ncbi:MAG TPA: SBBP repeat-containing protein [bacterium]|nr:SBBP repeat-containing protein [bacterium]
MRLPLFPLSAACGALFFLTACPGPVERTFPCDIDIFGTPDRDLPDRDTEPDEDADGLFPEDDTPDVDNDLPRVPIIIQWGSPGDDTGRAAEPARDGSIYVTGGTTDQLFGNTNAGSGDIFLTKIDPRHEFKWTKQWGTANFDQGFSLALDAGGSIYLSGLRNGIVDPLTGNGIGRMFIARFTGDGEENWTKEWGSFEQEYPTGVSVDTEGNAYVTGWTYGTVGENDNLGFSDIFLSRFDNAGNEAWSTQWGSGLIDVGYSVAAENSAGIYVTGWTYGDMSGEASLGGNDIFLTRLSANGAIDWTRQWGSYSEDKSFSVAIAPDGSILVGGATTGGLGGFSNIGGEDCFLVKFSPSGEQLWTYQWGTAKDDMAYAVAVGIDGTVYATGFTKGALSDATPKGANDVFLTAVSPNGIEQWTVIYGTAADETAQSLRLFEDWLILAGTTTGDLGKKNAGGQDIFVVLHPL